MMGTRMAHVNADECLQWHVPKLRSLALDAHGAGVRKRQHLFFAWLTGFANGSLTSLRTLCLEDIT